MKKIWHKITHLFYLCWAGLFYGMKGADEVISTSAVASDTSISVGQHSNRVSHALLRGELTQAVKELRHRTYKIDRESKNFEYFSPTLALRREKTDSKFVTYENKDNLPIVVIQPNDIYREGVNEGISHIGESMNKKHNVIKVSRDDGFTPRYKLEDYTTRLVVRRLEDANCVLDFYVSKYPDKMKFKSKGFIKEVESIRDNGVRSDVLDITGVKFTTYKAYNAQDLFVFDFKITQFVQIDEFDGSYILRFNAEALVDGNDLLKTELFNKEMEEKYNRKEAKEREPIDLLGGNSNIREYVCERCGKRVTNNEADSSALKAPRYVTEDIQNEDDQPNTMEYLDMELSLSTYGKCLCSKCLKRYKEMMPR